MTKSEFVDQVADRAGLSKKDAANAVDAVLETIEGTLSRGSEITFSGFGSAASTWSRGAGTGARRAPTSAIRRATS